MKQTKYPTERYAHDVVGFPVFAANRPIVVLVGPESMAKAIPADDEHCAIAEGCRAQLQTPYVSVGRMRCDLALPHPKGVIKPGFGDTLWAIYRFELPPSARRLVIAADTGQLDGLGIVVELSTPRPSCRPSQKQARNVQFRKAKGVRDGRGKSKGDGQDRLTLMGVRKLTAQRRRVAA